MVGLGSKKVVIVSICFGLALCLVFPVFAQLLPYPAQHTPFNNLPPKDSSQITRIVIDPVFIPHFNTLPAPKKSIVRSGIPFKASSVDIRFYFLCGVLFVLGLILRTSPRYFDNLFGLLFRSGFRQKSIRDQLVQNKLTSLGLNMLFFIAGGVFIYLAVQSPGLVSSQTWYIEAGLCISFLTLVYLVKYISIVAGGWIFASREVANQYVFIVFFVNKITGLFLLPVVVVLWLGNPFLHPFFGTISLILVGFLFLYRYYLVLPLVKSKSGISSFHFFLYLCTFEILPVLLLVKFLVGFLNSSN